MDNFGKRKKYANEIIHPQSIYNGLLVNALTNDFDIYCYLSCLLS